MLNTIKEHPILTIVILLSLLLIAIFPLLIFLVLLYIGIVHWLSQHNSSKFTPLSNPQVNPQASTDPRPSNYGYIGLFMSHEQKLEYMNSQKWWKIKQQMLSKYSACQHCNATDPLVIHHITYERLGNETLSDLAVLCRPCHETLHQKAGYSKFDTFPISILEQS